MTTKMRGRLVPSDRQQPKIPTAGDTKTAKKLLKIKQKTKKI